MRILSLLFILSFNLFGIETILKEYPELKSFFQNEEIQKLLEDYNIEIGSIPVSRNNIHIINTVITVYHNGITKRLAINPLFINKELISAEEFKFLFCHELGHKNLGTIKMIIPAIGLKLLDTYLTLSIFKSLYYKEWKQALNKSLIGIPLYICLDLIFKKVSRKLEHSADLFAIQTLKNKEDAISILAKKENWKPSYESDFLNKLIELFSLSPTEKSRIEHINNIKIV